MDLQLLVDPTLLCIWKQKRMPFVEASTKIHTGTGRHHLLQDSVMLNSSSFTDSNTLIFDTSSSFWQTSQAGIIKWFYSITRNTQVILGNKKQTIHENPIINPPSATAIILGKKGRKRFAPKSFWLKTDDLLRPSILELFRWICWVPWSRLSLYFFGGMGKIPPEQ